MISTIYASLDDIQVVGGSAGDGMNFAQTSVIYDGKAHPTRGAHSSENGAAVAAVQVR